MKKYVLGWQGIKDFIETVLMTIFLILVSIFAVIWAIFMMIKATGHNVKEFFIKKLKK